MAFGVVHWYFGGIDGHKWPFSGDINVALPTALSVECGNGQFSITFIVPIGNHAGSFDTTPACIGKGLDVVFGGLAFFSWSKAWNNTERLGVQHAVVTKLKNQNMKKAPVTILYLLLNICQIAAQQAPLFPKGGPLMASIAVKAGWAERNEYLFENSLPRRIYLKGGKSVSLSFSMGSNLMGFNLQYLYDRFGIDIEKTIAQNVNVSGLELLSAGQRQVQSTGFLIGPYFGSNLGKKKRFRAEILPAMGIKSTKSPSLMFAYTNGAFSFPSVEIQTRFIYSIGLGAEYRFAKGFSIGALWQNTFNNTPYIDNETSNNIFISLTYRLPL